MAISRVAGQMLKDVLERDGINISYANANVGINTSTPSERLEVVGNVKGDWFLGNVSTTGNIIVGNISVGNVSAGNISLGNLYGGNAVFTDNVTVTGTLTSTSNIVANISGIFYGNAITGVGALFAGIPGFTPLPNTVVQVAGNAEPYVQINFENINGNGTTDYIATADAGTDLTHYIDMGIAGSTYDNTTPNNSLGNVIGPLDAYLYNQGDGIGGTGGNLAIGTTEPGREIRIFTGGVNANSIVATISNIGLTVVGNIVTGNITISGNTITGQSNIILLPTGNVSVSNVNINNLAEPVANSDAATKSYVLSQIAGNVVNIGNLVVNDTTITTATANANISIDPNGTGTFVIVGTNGFVMPVGNTAQRPSPASAGTLRFNSEYARIEYYDGVEWDVVAGGVTNQTISTANGVIDTFTLTRESTTAAVLVMLNGIVQIPTIAYSVTGNSLVFTQAPAVSDIIDVRFL
jgi:hypothetical protein